MMNIGEMGKTAAALARGFAVTFRTMFRKPTTELFPDGPVKFEARYRGIHVLHRDENGLEKCVACFLCAAACPANCIYIEAAENSADKRISAGDRYAKAYNIDYSRCIFCGYCVESCPTDAITHGHGFELAPYNINALIYRKEQMLEAGAPKQFRPLEPPRGIGARGSASRVPGSGASGAPASPTAAGSPSAQAVPSATKA
jgi:NADH-quinone oxidoreductase subunit I